MKVTQYTPAKISDVSKKKIKGQGAMPKPPQLLKNGGSNARKTPTTGSQSNQKFNKHANKQIEY